jgi:hypothetical protein
VSLGDGQRTLPRIRRPKPRGTRTDSRMPRPHRFLPQVRQMRQGKCHKPVSGEGGPLLNGPRLSSERLPVVTWLWNKCVQLARPIPRRLGLICAGTSLIRNEAPHLSARTVASGKNSQPVAGLRYRTRMEPSAESQADCIRTGAPPMSSSQAERRRRPPSRASQVSLRI